MSHRQADFKIIILVKLLYVCTQLHESDTAIENGGWGPYLKLGRNSENSLAVDAKRCLFSLLDSIFKIIYITDGKE